MNMADTHGDHHDHTKLYYMIGGALGVATALSFVANFALGQNLSSAAIIMVVAIIKACLVGWIFMHLKWDWSRLYFLIFPVMIMGVMMVLVLLPDIVFAWIQPQPFEVPPQ